MGIRRIEHVQLAMPAAREDEAVAFYEGLLGIAEVPKPPHLAVRGGCWFERGELKVHLGVEADFRPALKAHPALLVDDLAGLADRLAAAGVTLREAGLPAQAAIEFRRVLRANSGLHDSHVQLGLTYYALGRAREALGEWQQVESEVPERPDIAMYLKLVSDVSQEPNAQEREEVAPR